MKNKLLNPKTIILYKSRDTLCIRVFGWGIYGINSKADWIPYSIKAGIRKLPIVKGYFIEFMIPLWLQKIKNNIMHKRFLGEKTIYQTKRRASRLK